MNATQSACLVLSTDSFWLESILILDMPTRFPIVASLRALVLATALSVGLCACGGASQTATEDAAPVAAYSEVPLTYDDSAYAVVPVTIGGQELPFLLDTAAYPSILTPWALDTLGLAQSADTMQVGGATGQSTARVVPIDSIQIGTRTVRNLEAPIVDLSRAKRSDIRHAGIFGNRALKNFDVVYDLPNERLRLYPIITDSVSQVAGLDTLQRVPFEDVYGGAGGFVTFPLSVGEGDVRAIMDTGSPITIFNWEAAALGGATRETATNIGTVSGLQATSVDLYRHVFSDIRVGDLQFGPVETRVADLPVFRRLGLEGEAAIVGNDFLANRIVVIAYSTGHVYFSSPLRQDSSPS
jgi:predicted aspartyl protease